jgi:alpha-galactosidase
MTSPLISQNHSKGGKKKDEQSMLLTSQNSSEIELTTSSYPSFGTLSNKIMNSAADCFYPNDDTAKDNDNNLDREYANNDHDDDDTNSSSSGSSYHGWKLTIPAPTYYSTSKYNSQCIEIFSSGKAGMKQNRINVMDGGDTKNNQDQDATVPIIQLPKPFSETNNDQFDSSIGLGMQLSKSSTYEDLEEEEEDVALLSSAAAGKRSPGKWHKEARLPTSPSSIPTAAWTYEAPHLTNWNISSQSLLTITYKKSIHCIPDFTNRNVCYDYISRAMKFSSSTCTKRNISMMNGEEDVKSGCCGSANVPVYSEVYTEKDIVNVNSYNIQITGFTGVCKAIQIQFRSKHSNSAENGGKNRFDYRNGKAKEQKLNEKLQLYLDRSKANQDVPFDGQSVLDEHDYGANNDYGLPLPPWDDKSEEKSAHGPIVTFAVPNLSDENQIDCLSSSFHNVIHDTVPLLWKVDFPPDPSIAIEAFTVLDGILDVHENSSNNDKEESDENKSTMSCSTCSTDECDASHPDNIYINGYQSWSFTGSVRQGETQPTSAMPDFLSKAFNYGADVPPAATINLNSENKNDCDHGITRPITQSLKRRCSQPVRMDNSDEELYPFHEAIHYTSDFYTCVSSKDIEMDKPQLETLCENSFKRSFNKKSETQLDEMGGTSLVLGFLSQRKQFGIVTFDSELERVAMHASLQGVIASRSGGISTDWAYCQILPAHTYDEEPMAYYLNAVSSYNNAKPLEKHPPLTGWCSWYHYYENIDLNTLKANFRKMSGLKSTITQDLAIIDDGYITAWGDWDSFKPKEFPKESGGMKALADNIEMNNMIPGLWMAPFACDKHSQIAKDHPDWIIRNDQGRVANSANCGKFFYGLDATNPEVRKFAFNSIHRAVKEWGYKCLKLDFLYAACLDGNGKYDLSMSRAETMYLALQTLRAAAGPDTFLIGCGCPLAPAIGYMDGMRISADTGPTWYPDFPLPWWDHATLPSLRAMIRNSTTRACLGHRWWHNDPDCILLGETTSLSDHEVVSAASIVAMTGKRMMYYNLFFHY